MRSGVRDTVRLGAALALAAAGSTCIVSIADLEPTSSSGGAGGVGGQGGIAFGGQGGTALGGRGGQGGQGGSDPCAAYAALVMSHQPIAYWRFEEANTSQPAHDERGAHDGTYQGGVSLGRPGALSCAGNAAAEFDGVDGQVVVSDEPFDFAPRATYSFEVWFKPLDEPSEFTNSQSVVSKVNWPDLGSGNPRGHSLRFGDTGGFIFQRQWALAQSDAIGIGTVSTAEFLHVVATYDTDQTIRMYVNGQSAGGGQLSDEDVIDHDEPLTFGKASSGGRPYHGLIDEVAVYDYALSESEARSHCEAGRGEPCPPL